MTVDVDVMTCSVFKETTYLYMTFIMEVLVETVIKSY